MNNEKIKRLLCIVGGMNAGGAETFLMKVYRVLDKTKYQMDFYVTTQEEGFYDKEILSLGGRIHRSIPKTKGFIKSFSALKNIVRKEKYNYVLRVSQHSLSTLDLVAAKLGGAKTIVYRSSNSGTGGGKINQILHVLFKWLSITIPTVKVAPSSEAAEFMFGKNSVKKGDAVLIKNAIAVDDFVFNQERRDKICKEFKIEDEFVIGHVGRFNNQKNHSFLIDIFSYVVKKHEKSVLLLVGKGELENAIKNKIKHLGLEDKVIFTGVRSDVSDIMMAMDVFVFPSFFEGMPNTVIEAQATGLYCVISDTITKEAKITELVEYISINDDARVWADSVLKYKSRYSMEERRNCFTDNRYNINLVTREIENLIFNS